MFAGDLKIKQQAQTFQNLEVKGRVEINDQLMLTDKTANLEGEKGTG